jgi:hypothetical protein
MSWSRDFDRVTALRPRTSIDQRWPAPQRDAVLEQVLSRVRSAPIVAERARRGGWPLSLRRSMLVVVAILGIAGASVGVAGAAGRLPDSFTRQVSGWMTDYSVDPQTAVRAGSVPGPDATVFTVWTAKGPNGSMCLTGGFESAQSAQTRAPNSFEGDGSTCFKPRRQRALFGETTSVAGDGHVYTFRVDAGSTARAQLRLADGRLLQTVLAQGQYLGWYSHQAGTPDPTLIAYDTSGKPVAELTVKTPGGR